MALHKVSKYLGYPKIFLFVVIDSTANFFFKLLPDKVYPDAINELQYRVAKMQTKLKINVQNGHAIFS